MIIPLPELILGAGVLGVLGVGAFLSSRRAERDCALLAIGVLCAVLIALLVNPSDERQNFGTSLQTDSFTDFVKIILTGGCIALIVLSRGFLADHQLQKFEYHVLLLLAVLGMFVMVSANDLLALYLGLEMQSLTLYILAAFQKKWARSAESGLKYFVTGAVSSGLVLYGCSLIYGFSGTIQFGALAETIASGPVSYGLTIGMVFLVSGLAFKLAAVPFHMWVPDVYEGSPTAVTGFFAVITKFAAFALFMRVLAGPFAEMVKEWQMIVIALSVGSMALGAFGALAQKNIKRLMAYSSIGHVGYALMGFAAGNENAVQAALVYLTLYAFMALGSFACILAMRTEGVYAESIEDLAGLSRQNRFFAFGLMVMMFSMAGLPPLAGFFAKFYVFAAALDAGLIFLAIFGALTSVVSAFYYLRIVRIVWFDSPVNRFDQPFGGLSIVLGVCIAVNSLFVFWPSFLIVQAELASRFLFSAAL